MVLENLNLLLPATTTLEMENLIFCICNMLVEKSRSLEINELACCAKSEKNFKNDEQL